MLAVRLVNTLEEKEKSRMSELRGGQLWVQEGFPFQRCYLVYIGGDSWCRIPPPLDGPGCIAITGPDNTEVLSPGPMHQLLKFQNYTCKGQYYDEIMGDKPEPSPPPNEEWDRVLRLMKDLAALATLVSEIPGDAIVDLKLIFGRPAR